jgi:hypothetical protein
MLLYKENGSSAESVGKKMSKMGKKRESSGKVSWRDTSVNSKNG